MLKRIAVYFERSTSSKSLPTRQNKTQSDTDNCQPPSRLSSILSIPVSGQIRAGIHRDYGVEDRSFHDRVRILLVQWHLLLRIHRCFVPGCVAACQTARRKDDRFFCVRYISLPIRPYLTKETQAHLGRHPDVDIDMFQRPRSPRNQILPRSH